MGRYPEANRSGGPLPPGLEGAGERAGEATARHEGCRGEAPGLSLLPPSSLLLACPIG